MSLGSLTIFYNLAELVIIEGRAGLDKLIPSNMDSRKKYTFIEHGMCNIGCNIAHAFALHA